MRNSVKAGYDIFRPLPQSVSLWPRSGVGVHPAATPRHRPRRATPRPRRGQGWNVEHMVFLAALVNRLHSPRRREPALAALGSFVCGANGIRTRGLFHAMEARYQLRHSPSASHYLTGSRASCPNQLDLPRFQYRWRSAPPRHTMKPTRSSEEFQCRPPAPGGVPPP